MVKKSLKSLKAEYAKLKSTEDKRLKKSKVKAEYKQLKIQIRELKHRKKLGVARFIGRGVRGVARETAAMGREAGVAMKKSYPKRKKAKKKTGEEDYFAGGVFVGNSGMF